MISVAGRGRVGNWTRRCTPSGRPQNARIEEALRWKLAPNRADANGTRQLGSIRQQGQPRACSRTPTRAIPRGCEASSGVHSWTTDRDGSEQCQGPVSASPPDVYYAHRVETCNNLREASRRSREPRVAFQRRSASRPVCAECPGSVYPSVALPQTGADRAACKCARDLAS